MNYILGYFFLLIIFIFLLISFKKKSEVKFVLLVAFLLRAICVVFDQFDSISLPDGYADASKFDTAAREFSRNYGLSVVLDFFKADSFLVSRIISIFYTIFYESKMMAQSLSVAIGTASVYLVYQLSLILWDYRSAKKAAWVAAIFPSLILYSSLTLREVYIVFFLLIGLIGIAKFVRSNSFASFLQVVTSMFTLMFFHGPLAIGGFIFLIYLLINLVKKQLIKLNSLKINISAFLLITLSFIPLILFFTNNFSFPYIGGIQTLFHLDEFIPKINSFMYGTSSYPSFLTINNNYELFTKTIIKIFYFLYSPFIWDIKTTYQIIGLFDGLLYIVLTIYVIKNWKAIWANPATRIFVLLLISYIIIYGISVGNFGSGIRHRSKFVVILIVLAAPKIHKFIFSAKNKLYNS